jgi:SpoVK/Ycf46/Vps4 family AAA+-type ATPase
LIYQNLPVITGKFFPFTENLLLPVNEILYRTIITTNRPDMIDKALMRPGRLDRVVYVPLPDEKTRLKIFKIHTRNKPLEASVDLEHLAIVTENYSGAEIMAVCNEAALKTLQESLDSCEVDSAKVTVHHFEEALTIVKPRISPSLLSIYDKFRSAVKNA